MSDIESTDEEQRHEPLDETATLTNAPNVYEPKAGYAPEPLAWVEGPFRIADDTDDRKSVQGWTTQYFGVYQEGGTGCWRPIHLPTGQSLAPRITYPTLEEAKTCCAALMSLGIDWSLEDPEAMKRDPLATLTVASLTRNGLRSFLILFAMDRRYERHSVMLKRSNALNRAVVFEALRDVGVVTVGVEFNGGGDEGQIEAVSAVGAEGPIELPPTPVIVHTADDDRDDLGTKQVDLSSAIEGLCYGYLEEHHDGWEIGEGAYGEYQFDISTGTIELQFNGRIIDVETHNHTL